MGRQVLAREENIRGWKVPSPVCVPLCPCCPQARVHLCAQLDRHVQAAVRHDVCALCKGTRVALTGLEFRTSLLLPKPPELWRSLSLSHLTGLSLPGLGYSDQVSPLPLPSSFRSSRLPLACSPSPPAPPASPSSLLELAAEPSTQLE